MKTKLLYFVLGAILASGVITALFIRHGTRASGSGSVYPSLGLLYIDRENMNGGYYSMWFGSRFSFGDTVIVKAGDASGTTGTVRGIILNTTTSLLYQVEIKQGKLVDVSTYELDAASKRR
jgi:hypothetical protein